MNTRLEDLEPVGYTLGGTPVYPVYGAQELDAEPDEDDGPDEGGEPEPEDDDGKKGKSNKYVPPDEKEWIRVQASLNKANASAKTKREAAAALERRVRELEDEKTARDAEEERRKLLADRQPPAPADSSRKGRKGAASATPPGPTDLPANVLTPAQVKAELAKARREERETVASEYLDIARRSAARVALADAKVPKESLGRLIRLIELDEIELDSDGEVVGGLDEQVESLRTDFPQLFAPTAPEEPAKKSRPRPPRIPAANGSARPAAPERKLSTAEQMAESILGGR